jgi:hypothetical protein
MSFKEVTAETNCPNRHTGSSIALLDLTISSCERLDKSCWTSIVRAVSNQDSADESLMSITNVLYGEVKGVLELKRMVDVATGGCLTLSTPALCQDAASPCSRLNPRQVLWPSYSRHLGRNAFRWADWMGLSNAHTPQIPCRRCCLMRGCMMPGICGALREVVCCHSLFPVIIRRAEVLVLVHDHAGRIS